MLKPATSGGLLETLDNTAMRWLRADDVAGFQVGVALLNLAK